MSNNPAVPMVVNDQLITPSSSFSSSYQQFRAAIHLNNTGVALLERHCWREAMHTLRDAVTAMKVASLPAFCESPIHLDNTVERAAKRLANAKPLVVPCDCSCSSSSSSTPSPTNQDWMRIEVIADDEYPSKWLQQRYLCLKNVFYPIRINVAAMDTTWSPEELSCYSSILMYNYGMVYRCLSQLPESETSNTSNNKNDVQMFRLAYTTLFLHSRSHNERSSDDMDDDATHIEPYRLFLVALLILTQLVEACQYHGLQYEVYEERLRFLQEEMVYLADMQKEFCVHAAAAA